ncbi:AfsR/SARP family transcriptional regulator [Virgisporangium aurantiacum]|uniref:AfsR/SARP family transcriptional regulator n=1 Tax=Virgisporangium aurantiacum TaxID=175570 RepID=UPI00194E9A14|nr:BTAD domain-containing putative transcriptional regulator [Virgisporangium aurantiacum]
MQVRLLGPLDVTRAGQVVEIPGLRRKAVLAVLALHPGDVVRADQLIDLVWAGSPPATAANTLQSHVSYLRRVLGHAAIVARPPGYLLSLGTDVQVADGLIGAAKRVGDRAAARSDLEAALALWRGPALTDTVGVPWLEWQAERLTELHLDATLALAEIRLETADHDGLAAELEQLARQHRWNERLHRCLMLALYRVGRQREALAAYQRLRRSLDEDLGIAPSPPLQDLEVAILRQDPVLGARPPVKGTAVVPAQLPAGTNAFSRRRAELAYLDSLVGDGAAHGVPIAVISGMAGVGKTALAVHWGHRVADRFPDGQLYANLRGFHPTGPALDPSDALRGFLDACGVARERIPAGLDAQAALFRSVVNGKRMLVVLDNARDVDQVRPLLPGSPSSAVVITSRNRLAELVIAEGARPLALDLPSRDDARELLVRRLGADRFAAEPEATAELIARCARLPLALAVAAASCAIHPELSVAAVAAQLGGAAGVLSAPSGADGGADVRAVFSWSYRTLGRAAARLFRLAGLHPGTDISAAAAAGLAGLPAAETGRLLAELARAHLLTEPEPGRYAFHDLLRAYAAELALQEESGPDRAAAELRLVDHYLHSAIAAATRLDPRGETIDVPPPAVGCAPVDLPDHDRATAWFVAERSALLATIALAAGRGLDGHTWRLARAMQGFLDRWTYWEDQAANQRLAIDAAGRERLPAVEANAQCSLATAYAQLRRFDAAQQHLERAFDRYGQLPDDEGQAKVQYQLGWLANQQGDADRALRHARLAVHLYRRAGNEVGAARALNSLGWDHALRGDHLRARSRCEQALAQLRRLGDRRFEAAASDSLGFIHHHLGDHRSAIDRYEQAARMYREIGDRFYEADTLHHLGDARLADGDRAAAAAAWRAALAAFPDPTHPDAQAVARKLADR